MKDSMAELHPQGSCLLVTYFSRNLWPVLSVDAMRGKHRQSRGPRTDAISAVLGVVMLIVAVIYANVGLGMMGIILLVVGLSGHLRRKSAKRPS